MSNSKKIKVAWICHFTNEEINALVNPNKAVSEMAPWIPMAIRTVEGCESLDVHVISPWPNISSDKQIELRGIHYYFYNPYLFNRPRLLYNKHFSLDFITNFRRARSKVCKYVNQIKPDVIHLYGVENPYYSASFFDLKDKYPFILSVQGFIYKEKLNPNNKFSPKRIEIERNIIEQSKVSFYETSIQAKDIQNINPRIELFYHTYGSYEIPLIEPRPKKKYDLVFFARVCKDKGIVDLMDALVQVKNTYPKTSLLVIGGGDLDGFKEYAKEHGIEGNISWAGFQRTREDVFKLASEARISILPTHNDVIPGTVMESMFLELPVITNNVGSIPIINEDGNEYIIMNECGNIQQLVSSIEKLLADEQLREDMAEKAYKRAKELFAPSNDKLQRCLITGYTRSIELFKEKNKQE